MPILSDGRILQCWDNYQRVTFKSEILELHRGCQRASKLSCKGFTKIRITRGVNMRNDLNDMALQVSANSCLDKKLLLYSSIKVYLVRTCWNRELDFFCGRRGTLPSCCMIQWGSSDGVGKNVDIWDDTFMHNFGEPKKIIENRSKNLKQMWVSFRDAKREMRLDDAFNPT